MRVRFRFTKLGKVRFTSHRDVARMWERALRRASLPVAYSEGFSPRPRIAFGLALPTGYESIAEFLDVDLAADTVDAGSLPEVLSACLPAGIDVTAAELTGGPSLQEAVGTCSWRIEVLDLDTEGATQLVSQLLAAGEIIVTRQRKGREVTDDLRPAVRSVTVTGPTPGGCQLDAELAVHPRSVRPTELVDALAPGAEIGRVLRTAQWIWRDGAREEPLCGPPSGATPAPHALERAS